MTHVYLRDTRIRIPTSSGQALGPSRPESGCASVEIETKKPVIADWLSSGYQDSNLGPPVPKTGALPGCATSRKKKATLFSCEAQR
jgi:hypothetical protein